MILNRWSRIAMRSCCSVVAISCLTAHVFQVAGMLPGTSNFTNNKPLQDDERGSLGMKSNRSSWKLEDYIIQFLLNHQVVETIEMNHSAVTADSDVFSTLQKQQRYMDSDSTPQHQKIYNVTWSYPSVCGHLPVQESTATLLVARVFAKAGQTSLAWSILDSLFEGQNESGFVPKYLYGRQLNQVTDLYIASTSIPNWRMFSPFFNQDNQGSMVPISSQLGRKTSLRVSAFPLHASVVHDIFLTSRQSLIDVAALERNVNRIYQYHSYLHDAVMRNCRASLNSSSDQSDELASSGCYNTLHPWESLAFMESPMWQHALNATIQASQLRSWTRSWPLPSHVKHHFPFYDSEPVYNASIFLLECIANASSTWNNLTCLDRSISCEEELLISSCPYFAMLDVGYAAALTKADSDLYQSIQILLERSDPKKDRAKFWKGRMAQVRKWQEQNEFIWDHLLWDAAKETFSSRYLSFPLDSASNLNPPFSVYNSTLRTLSIATSNDFLAYWANPTSDARLQSMASHLVQKHGDQSFDCGDVGLWPRGGCDQSFTQQNKWIEIDPLVNWLVGSGLQRSGEVALGKYLDQSTLQLVCSWKPFATAIERAKSIPVNLSSCDDPSFQAAYLINSNISLVVHPIVESCDSTVLATAAIVYDLLVPDTTHHEIPIPPIRNSWVITLIAVELGVAFSIGLSCLSLSWVLTCRLQSFQSNDIASNPMNGGTRSGYLPSHSESFGEPYFSARGSIASSDDDDGNDSLSASLLSNEMAETGNETDGTGTQQ